MSRARLRRAIDEGWVSEPECDRPQVSVSTAENELMKAVFDAARELDACPDKPVTPARALQLASVMKPTPPFEFQNGAIREAEG